MATAVTTGVITVGTWQECDTTIAPVLGALDRLRRSDRRGAVRASFLTLLAVGGERVEVDEVFDTVHRLGPFQPSRVIVVRVLRGDHHRLDARVGVHLQSRGSQCVGIDDVALEVAGPVTAHLDSLVEPLTLPDLPVVVWCRERLPPARSRLIDLADHLVVDTVAAGGRSRLPAVARLHRRTPVIDFAWLRLFPLRRRLAASFLRPDLRRLLDEVEAVTVTGPEVDRALLAGWLLDCFPGAVVGEEGDHASMSITLEGDDFRMSVETAPNALTATLTRDGHQPWRSESAWSPPTTDGLLAESLLGLRSDPVFTRALSRT
ncbi:MAG TPA: glucose-6-phosphate dehydrogenase assembly protein OpcA [Acidimicrobiales bacterium]|nr:glucose-6-phosphate dehydrogenase assembly protein OpcA [Acidimicrobiales bacterium]